MQKAPRTKHFLNHTAEYLLGVIGVLVVAVGVSLFTPSLGNVAIVGDTVRPTEPTIHVASVLSSGVSLYWDGARDNIGVVGYRLFKNGALIANQQSPTFTDTTNLEPGSVLTYAVAAVDASGNSSVLSTPTYATVPPSNGSDAAGNQEIYFSVTPAPVVDCSSGKPMHEVFFVASDPSGGDFLLSSPENNMTNSVISWGRQLLPNGEYSWQGVPRDGYVISGVSVDKFTLTGMCPLGSTASPVYGTKDSSVSPSTSHTESNGIRPTLRFFVDSIPVSDTERHFSGENVELRVSTSRAKKVNYYAIKEKESTPVSLGVGSYDDLLSLKENDIWVMTLQTRNISSGTYKLFARVLFLSGEVAESLPMSVVITNERISSMDNEEQVSAQDDSGFLKKEVVRSILHVTDPSLCSDVVSCKSYCSKGSSEQNGCFEFARRKIFNTSLPYSSSLAEHVSGERINRILLDTTHRPKDLPEYVDDESSFNTYCRDMTHKETCQRILLGGDLSKESELSANSQLISAYDILIRKILSERIGVRPYIDTDNDHVSDYDEINIYGTNPSDADSDDDGFQDGEEIINHTDPLGAQNIQNIDAITNAERGMSEEVTLEDPRLLAGLSSPLLSVERVTLNHDEQDSQKEILSFSGFAPPNSYVTLFVFSNPMAFTVKTNASGTWEYTMGTELLPGTHEAIVSISDAKGRVFARSPSLDFVQDGKTVTVAPASTITPESTPTGAYIFAGIALLLALIGISFSIVGFLLHHRRPHANSPILFQ